VESPISTLRSISACKRFSVMQHVCATYVPKLKLPYPNASLVFLWGQVAALPRLGAVALTVVVGHLLTS